MPVQKSTQHPELLYDHWYASFFSDPFELDKFLRNFWNSVDEEKQQQDKEKKKQVDEEQDEATQDDYYDPSVWDQK